MSFPSKPSYTMLASALPGPAYVAPAATLPSAAPPRARQWGSFQVDYDDIITKAFTVFPPEPSMSWLLLRSIFLEHPERITVTAAPHANHAEDSLHISLRVNINAKGHYVTVHLYGTFTASPDSTCRWWNYRMTTQMGGIKLSDGRTCLTETVADWGKAVSTPASTD